MKIIYLLLSLFFVIISSQLFSFCSNKAIVREIKIIGQKNCPKKDLDKILSEILFKPILKIDLAEIQNSFIKIDWVKNVWIKRSLFGILTINIEEKKPIAYFTTSSTKSLIDENGDLLRLNSKNFDLPIICGENAKENAKLIINLVSKFPKIQSKILAYNFIRNYRWNLIGIENVIIKLPQENIESSLLSLNKIIDEIDFSKTKHIDLRVLGQVIIRPIITSTYNTV